MKKTQQRQKQQHNYNFFLKGKRISDPIPVVDDRGNMGYSFDMEILQTFQSNEFAPLKIGVNVPKQTWEEFLTKTEETTEWLQISGRLASEMSIVDRHFLYTYRMEAMSISNFDALLYDQLGGQCYFSGQAKLLYKTQSNKNNLYVKKLCLLPLSGEKLEVVALRRHATKLDDLNIRNGSFVDITANLMPSTNDTSKPPFFSMKEAKNVVV